MKRCRKIPLTFVTLLLLPLMMLNTACEMSLFAKPTSTPIPTATKTPLPTSTNTPIITNTRTATPNRLATLIAYHEPAVLEQMTAFGLPTDSGGLGWYEAVTNDSIYPEIGKIADNLSAADFILYTQLTWEEDEQLECSLRFRWTSDAYYELDLNSFHNAPTWDITYNEYDAFVSWISEKKPSRFLKPWSGETNAILLVVVGNRIKVFLNGYLEGEVFDDYSRLSEGMFGVQTWRYMGIKSCTFGETWVWVYK
jgi:hypothetical protein